MLRAFFGRAPVESVPVDLQLSAGGWTAQGRERDVNQDQWVANPIGGTFIVADGIGGGACGDIASRVAVECLRHQLSDDGDEALPPEDMIHAAFAAAREKILQTAASRDCTCMGTTAACGIVRNDELIVGWTGDSRIYLLRDDEIRLLTRDHTLAQGLADAGAIASESVECHRMRNVLWNFLGTGSEVPGTPDVNATVLKPGDRIILATDGVTDVLTDCDLQSLASHCITPKVAASRIVHSALANGAIDDATCLVVFVED